MFRCQAVGWSILIWSLVFLNTLFSYLEFKPMHRAIPIMVLLAAIALFVVLVARVARQTKSLLLFAGWGFVVSVALLLRTLRNPSHPDKPILEDWHFNLLVTIFTGIASVIWCLLSHAEHVTETGLHWYVWSTITIFATCSAFHNDSQTAVIIYIVNASILTLAHILYVRHVLNIQTPGQERCKHVFRVIACFFISIALLATSILFKTNDIDNHEWQECVLIIEGVFLAVIVLDGIIGFTQSRIKWSAIETSDVDELI